MYFFYCQFGPRVRKKTNELIKKVRNVVNETCDSFGHMEGLKFEFKLLLYE